MDQAGLKLRDPPASAFASLVLGLKAGATKSGTLNFLVIFFWCGSANSDFKH